MQISLLDGIVTDGAADFRTSYPLNLVPVPKDTGISKGYLRTSDGMVRFANRTTVGTADRGGISWNGVCYRVDGKYLISVAESGLCTRLGFVDDDGKRVVFTYGFDQLAIASAGKLYLYDPVNGVLQVTDADLGRVLDVIWIAGYFMVTDGDSLVVTELNDPFQVNPLKYGSSEASPDPINGLLAIRNEVYAVNRYTTEVFQNVGGSGFPFQRIDGGMIPKGSVGTHASCYYLGSFAFVGSGFNENVSVYVAGAGEAVKIATREIETVLSQYTAAQLASVVVEERSDKQHEFLYVHLPDRSLVYDAYASRALGEPMWHVLASGTNGDQPYRARNFALCYGKWLFGDMLSTQIGYLTDEDAREFGATVPWQFDTALIYNEGRGGVFHDLELVRLPGRMASNPTLLYPVTQEASVFHSYTQDGLTWSTPRMSGLTKPGMTKARCTWRSLGRMDHWRGLRFRGMNNPFPDAFARLEANVEPLGN